jgi:hypothetical protein
LASRFLTGLVTFGFSVFASLSAAQTPTTFYYQTYLNLDGNAATGCTVIVPDTTNTPQTLSGVEVTLLLTVTNGALVSAERFECISNVLVSQGLDTSHPTYTLGGSFVEFQIPNVTITSQSIVGFAASTSSAFDVSSDVFFLDDNGQPISLASLLSSGNRSGNAPVPTSTPILLLLIAIATGTIAARYLRSSQGRHLGAIALFVCFASLSGATYSATQIFLDGTGQGWDEVPVLATAAEDDAPHPEIKQLGAKGYIVFPPPSPGQTSGPPCFSIPPGPNPSDWPRFGICFKLDLRTRPPVHAAAPSVFLLAAKDGVVYFEEIKFRSQYLINSGPYKVGRYRPADNSQDFFEVDTHDHYLTKAPEFAGVDLQGKMYFQHNDSWECDVESPESVSSCITVQGDNVPTQLVLSVPRDSLDEKVTLRFVETLGGTSWFYAVRLQAGYICPDFIVERWNSNGEVSQIARIVNSPANNDDYTCQIGGQVVQADVVGQDLLLQIGYRPNAELPFVITSVIVRVRSNGQIINVPFSYEDRDKIIGVFAEDDANCYLRRHNGIHPIVSSDIYRCGVGSALLPTQEFSAGTGFFPPAMNAQARKLYYVDSRGLWVKERPAATLASSSWKKTLWQP